MNMLLVIGVGLALLALLGFAGVLGAVRSAAWLVLTIAAVLIVLSFVL